MKAEAMLANDPSEAIRTLNEALRAKYNSLVRYALSANPYARPADLALVEALERTAAEDEEEARLLAEAIEALEGIPDPGMPEPIVGEIAYLSVRRLAQLCLERKAREAETFAPARVRAIAGGAGASGNGARRLLQRIAETDRRQTDLLRALLAPAA